MNQILNKISKALELGTNNTNENEAQSAILAAQRLMAKYHISQEEVNEFLNENENQEEEVIEENATDEINNEKWKRNLIIVIAKNFRCDVFYRCGRLIIVGESEDIKISKRVFLYAKQAVLNSFKKFFNENYVTNDSNIRNKCKRDFAYGFVSGLRQKFEEQKENSDLALVVVNPKVKEYFKNINFGRVHRSRSQNISDGYCYQYGKEKGRNLADIDTQMKGEF